MHHPCHLAIQAAEEAADIATEIKLVEVKASFVEEQTIPESNWQNQRFYSRIEEIPPGRSLQCESWRSD